MMPHKLTAAAKRLCTNLTDAERVLWKQVRAQRFYTVKFKRQQPLGKYIVDFVSFEAHLVIEIDGGQHAAANSSDADRDAWLAGQGFRILRFWNNEVLDNLDGVLMRISEYLPPSPRPSPIKGEGEEKRAKKIAK
jgi:very-short-patch-repair endonuclease